MTQSLIRDLRDGRLDVAIVALPVSEPALAEQPLFRGGVHPRATGKGRRQARARLDRLQELRLLLLEEGHCFRDQALAFCGRGTGTARDQMEGSSLATLVQMVGAGIGVTLIPEMALSIETRSADVAMVRLPEPRPLRTIGMVWRQTSPLAGEFEQIAACVKQVALANRVVSRAGVRPEPRTFARHAAGMRRPEIDNHPPFSSLPA